MSRAGEYERFLSGRTSFILHHSCFILPSSIPIIRRARSFTGNHRRAQRPFGRAVDAEGGAIVRLSVALQHLAGDALRRFLGRDLRNRETPLRVKCRVTLAKPQAAHGYFADAPPFARRAQIRLPLAAGLRRFPAGRTDRAYWFSTSCRPASSCRTHISTPCRISSGSKPVTTIGTRNFSASGLYSAGR